MHAIAYTRGYQMIKTSHVTKKLNSCAANTYTGLLIQSLVIYLDQLSNQDDAYERLRKLMHYP